MEAKPRQTNKTEHFIHAGAADGGEAGGREEEGGNKGEMKGGGGGCETVAARCSTRPVAEGFL